MPPKKRASIGQINPQARRAKLLRAAETPEQRESRLEQQRVRQAEVRADEAPHVYEKRLEQQRVRQAEVRAGETTHEYEERMADNRFDKHSQGVPNNRVNERIGLKMIARDMHKIDIDTAKLV
jgi:hypothetical protein